jgi:hypothetical protein
MFTQSRHSDRGKVVWGGRIRLAGLIACALLAGSCGQATRDGRAASYLIIERLMGAPGGPGASTPSNVVLSDVLTNGTVFEDPGRVTLRLALRDPGAPGAPTAPTTNNFITINRYRVVYRRSDGRNQEGVDVPFAFDGATTFTVGTGAADGGFTLVRVQAKLEAPLRALRGGGGVISTITEVTFYGRDQTGREVSVTGTMSVNFADWADPQ